MIRVLIVDDSPTIRSRLRQILNSDPELTVIAEAQNGEEAIELCRRLDPDILTMDIHMPQMDGYTAIRRIMAEYPRPIIVLTSTESEARLGTALKGTASGALMVFGKPHGLPGEDPEADLLVAHVKAMAGVKVIRRRWRTSQIAGEPKRKTMQVPDQGILAIGASTGGPPALRTILTELPSDLPVPIVLTQHISVGFVEGMSDWLNDTIPLEVRVAKDGDRLRPGVVCVAPDHYHLEVAAGGRVRLRSGPPVDGHCPSVTALFGSVARIYGHSAIGILLTGMGRDGAGGLKKIRDAGGDTVVQDEESSVVFGMPKEAIALGAAKEVLPLSKIGQRLVELMRNRE